METTIVNETDAFCQKCGAKVTTSTEICMNCGCETGFKATPKEKPKKKKSTLKTVILIAVLVVAIAALAVVGYLIWKNIRTEQVKEDLAGKTFSSNEYNYYADTYSYKHFRFDANSDCEYEYYYSSIDSGDTYWRDYEIKFEKDMVLLEIWVDTLEVQYDKYGEIDCLVNITTGEKYEWRY